MEKYIGLDVDSKKTTACVAQKGKYCFGKNANANVLGSDAVSQRENAEQQRTDSGCLIVRLSPIHYTSSESHFELMSKLT